MSANTTHAANQGTTVHTQHIPCTTLHNRTR